MAEPLLLTIRVLENDVYQIKYTNKNGERKKTKAASEEIAFRIERFLLNRGAKDIDINLI